MTNLWEETERMLTAHEKTFKDVKYIQGSIFGITKENFERVAKKSKYYSGFGALKGVSIPTKFQDKEFEIEVRMK